jgi:hypothetical protein
LVSVTFWATPLAPTATRGKLSAAALIETPELAGPGAILTVVTGSSPAPTAKQEFPPTRRQQTRTSGTRSKPAGIIHSSFANSELGYGFLIGDSMVRLSLG